MKEITLHNGQVALVDDQDFDLVGRFHWTADARGGRVYATRQARHGAGRRTTYYMHRVLMNPPAGLTVDHKNGNGLDNRRSNLRLATRVQNAANRGRSRTNTSGFKGVFYNKPNKAYSARICADNQIIHLGWFKDKTVAARAYDEAARQLHGDFAALNLP